MFKKILLAAAALLGVAVIVFGVLVYMQPDELVVVRSATMDAPPAAVFDQVNDLERWQAWSPWAKLDPQAKNSFSGPKAGEGAVFGWSGNDQIGEGQMTITQSDPNELVRMRLEFVRPMEDQADIEFRFVPQGEQTKVTWTMSGKNTLMSKVFSVFVDMEAMVGSSFEEGLSNLKKIVEAQPQQPAGPDDKAAAEPDVQSS